MNGNNFSLRDHTTTAEEMLGPPRIDTVGIFLMSLVAILVGGIISLGVLVASFFSMGQFSIESGVSPMILAMATFFSLVVGSMIYLSIAKVIFPTIYTRTNNLLKHTMLYMIVLYLVLMPMYLFAANVQSSSILVTYLVHILLAIFGVELILSLISQYRYALLSFYANIASVTLSGGFVFLIFASSKNSSTNLFILMGLSILTFFVSTLLIFLVKFFYYKFYTLTGNDPLGAVFFNIEEEEKFAVKDAQNTLLQK